MGEAKSRNDGIPATPEAASARSTGLGWLAWGWVALLLLAVAAEVLGNDDLRLALDFSRHLRAP